MKITNAKLTRIDGFIADARRYFPSPWFVSHGNLIGGTGGLIAEPSGNGGAALRLAQFADPNTMEELIRGYRLAKKAGLL